MTTLIQTPAAMTLDDATKTLTAKLRHMRGEVLAPPTIATRTRMVRALETVLALCERMRLDAAANHAFDDAAAAATAESEGA